MNMVHYKVLARKYRPNSLVELQGQDVFVRILNNSIKSGKLAHAYLLTGIRGVGKTSIARIIAKTISCELPKIDQAITIPCGKCKSCKLIEAGNHTDILEFDAASRTGVNDIREVIDSVHYAPVYGQYKIYIIDEVHMLSNSAFNALLKILEEPPENVVFIFATTESRKLPLTVMSRCQRFDLHRFNVEDIAKHLEKICKGEKIDYESEALSLIAKYSGGSMRDALTLLESVTAMGNKALDSKLVREVLGINDVKSLYSLLYHLLAGNVAKALENLHALYGKGSEISDVVNDLLVIATKVSKYIAANKDEKILDLVDNYELELVKKLCKSTDISRLTTVWQILLKGIKELKFVDDALSAVEMLVIRCCYASSLPSLDEMLVSGKKSVDSLARVQEKIDENVLPSSFEEVVKLFYKNKEMILYHQLRSDVHCHGLEETKLRFTLDKNLPSDFVAKVINKLNEFTGQTWGIETVSGRIDKTKTLDAKEMYDAQNHDVIKEIIKDFPGTKVKNINELASN